MEESTEHGTKPRVVWRPRAIGQTPSGEIMRGEIGGEEAISTDESDSVCEDGARDRVTGAQPSTLDNRFSSFSLETGIEFKMVNVPVEFLCSGGNFFVWIPFQE